MPNALMIQRNTIEDSLKDIFSSVVPHTSNRFDCPSCGGKNDFSVTNTGVRYVYNCFRNTCDLRGYSPYIPTSEELKQYINNANKPKLEDFKLPTYINQSIGSRKALDYIVKHNGLEAYRKGLYKIGYDTCFQKLVYMLVDNGTIKGAVGRSLNGTSPKAMIYPNSAVMPFICGIGHICVIVEDCASAAAVGGIDGYTGLALLGTRFKTEYIQYLYNYDKFIIALDADAKKKAIEIKSLLSLFKRDVTIWNLISDIKDKTKDELAALFC
jgi:hypothetical protein